MLHQNLKNGELQSQQIITWTKNVRIPARGVTLDAELSLPLKANGIVIFAHNCGSSRHSPRSQLAARTMRSYGIGTLLFDLLTPEEESEDIYLQSHRFNIVKLAERLESVNSWLESSMDWITDQACPAHLRRGYFGSRTGAAAALVAAAELGDRVSAVVSNSGRPDLAGQSLAQVKSATLLILSEREEAFLSLTREAFQMLKCEKDMKLQPNVHLLSAQAAALAEVRQLAGEWFQKHL